VTNASLRLARLHDSDLDQLRTNPLLAYGHMKEDVRAARALVQRWAGDRDEKRSEVLERFQRALGQMESASVACLGVARTADGAFEVGLRVLLEQGTNKLGDAIAAILPTDSPRRELFFFDEDRTRMGTALRQSLQHYDKAHPVKPGANVPIDLFTLRLVAAWGDRQPSIISSTEDGTTSPR
jgi:hypothetical protein